MLDSRRGGTSVGEEAPAVGARSGRPKRASGGCRVPGRRRVAAGWVVLIAVRGACLLQAGASGQRASRPQEWEGGGRPGGARRGWGQWPAEMCSSRVGGGHSSTGTGGRWLDLSVGTRDRGRHMPSSWAMENNVTSISPHRPTEVILFFVGPDKPITELVF
jgi:hypothetical protein